MAGQGRAMAPSSMAPSNVEKQNAPAVRRSTGQTAPLDQHWPPPPASSQAIPLSFKACRGRPGVQRTPFDESLAEAGSR
jgi:hypothetical protein